MLKEDFIKDFAKKYSVVYLDDIDSGVFVKEVVNGTYLMSNAEVKE